MGHLAQGKWVVIGWCCGLAGTDDGGWQMSMAAVESFALRYRCRETVAVYCQGSTSVVAFMSMLGFKCYGFRCDNELCSARRQNGECRPLSLWPKLLLSLSSLPSRVESCMELLL